MVNDLVSIIMPSFNSARFIAESIESVLSQTYAQWELLITDDCSKDNSLEIINSYVAIDDRIKIFALNNNVGAASARNISLDKAKGRYIAFLDSDDIWEPHKLETQLSFMKTNGYEFTFSAYSIMANDGKLTGKIVSVPPKITYEQYLKNTIIGCLTVIIDRRQTSDFRMPLIKSSHDMALWLLIMKRGFRAYALNEVLATYRLVSTSNTANKWKAVKDVWKVYRDIEGLSFFKSTICFCCYIVNAIIKRI